MIYLESLNDTIGKYFLMKNVPNLIYMKETRYNMVYAFWSSFYLKLYLNLISHFLFLKFIIFYVV